MQRVAYRKIFHSCLPAFSNSMKRMRAVSHAHIQADGWTLAICTNKPHAVTTRLLADLGIDHHFAAVLGGDSLPVGKPDPEPVLAVLRAVGGDGRRSVIVGDHANDLAAGQAAGIATILARYGYGGGSVNELTAAAAIDSFAQLPDAIARLFD
jgi:phosphoglycolate phosphatase